jgi:hypothetical protein
VVDNGFPNVLNPAYAYIPDESPGRTNRKGETSFLTEEGDQMLDSIMASVKQNQTAAQSNPVPPVPTPPANNQQPLGQRTAQSRRPQVLREREERRPKYRFPNVRLEGVEDNSNITRVDDAEEDKGEDNGRSKKLRVDDSEEDPDAEGSTDDGEDFVPTQDKRQVAVILDHGMDHPAPFRRGPPKEPTPRYHPLVDDFISMDLLNRINIPRNPTQGSSGQLSVGTSRRGGSGDNTVNRSARSPCECLFPDVLMIWDHCLIDVCHSIAVELFVPGLVLPPQEVNRWNTDLASGIRWSHQSAQSALSNIQYILLHLPQLISSHSAIPKEEAKRVWKDLDVTSRTCESGMSI